MSVKWSWCQWFSMTHHESLHNLKVVVDDLGQRSQTVGGTGSIAAVERNSGAHLSLV